MSSATTSPAPKRVKYSHTLGPQMTVELEAHRQVTPPSGGYRKISVRCYSPLSSPESDAMTDFPEVAESVETLRLAGFTQEAAEEVFRRFEKVRVNENNEFGGFGGESVELDQVACMYIEGRAAILDACAPGDDYRAAWECQGMAAERYEGALDPKYDIIRLRDSASGHFIDSVRSTAEYVFTLAKKIQAQRLSVDARRGESSPSPSLRPSAARRSREEQRQIRAPPAPIVSTEVDLPKGVPGCTMLYKGSNLARLQAIFPDQNSSIIRLRNVKSIPPTDFHRTDPDIFYATKQLEVTEIYCGFARNIKGQHIQQGIMHIAVPNELLERSDFHWIHGEEWRRLVWASRGKEDPFQEGRWRVPSDVSDYVSGFGLAGNICERSTDGLIRLEGESEIKAMKLSTGSTATQYAFFADAFHLLNSRCEGQVWIEERILSPEGKLAKSTGKAAFRAKIDNESD